MIALQALQKLVNYLCILPLAQVKQVIEQRMCFWCQSPCEHFDAEKRKPWKSVNPWDKLLFFKILLEQGGRGSSGQCGFKSRGELSAAAAACHKSINWLPATGGLQQVHLQSYWGKSSPFILPAEQIYPGWEGIWAGTILVPASMVLMNKTVGNSVFWGREGPLLWVVYTHIHHILCF